MLSLDRVLIVAPHPDDDVIAAGGLIQRVLAAGGNVRILFITDGERNVWPQRWMLKKWRISAEDRAAWGAMRRDEANDSLTTLGVPTNASAFLGFPDQGISPMMRRGDTRLIQAIRKAIVDFLPSLIISPSAFDLHVDHRAISCAAHFAAAGEVPVHTYVVHGAGDRTRAAETLELTETESDRKRAAIECHRSQLMLSRERFLSYAARSETFYAAEYAFAGIGNMRSASLRYAVEILLRRRAASGVEPAADVQDRPGDVPGLL